MRPNPTYLPVPSHPLCALPTSPQNKTKCKKIRPNRKQKERGEGEEGGRKKGRDRGREGERESKRERKKISWLWKL